MSSTLSGARVLYGECASPLQFVRRLNSVMCRCRGTSSFVTLFVGFLDPASGLLRYVDAGHPRPQIVRAGELRMLEVTGIPIGMMPEFAWEECDVVLESGETFVAFSDGNSDAERGMESFAPERLEAALCEGGRERDLSAFADHMIEKLDEFERGERRVDDVTLLLLRRA